MLQNALISENNLDEWVRGNNQKAQGTIVELVWRLVSTSCQRPKARRFPLADSIAQPGPDGFLDTELGFDPFVPSGKSYWQIGVGTGAARKAGIDYSDLTNATPVEERSESTFIFVTPLSGRRDWPHTWKSKDQAAWRERKRKKADWKDVRVIDGTCLIDWLGQFPSVSIWLAAQMNLPSNQIETPLMRWRFLETIGGPPNLHPALFLAGRESASEKLGDVFAGTNLQLKLDTRFTRQTGNFVAAYLTNLPAEDSVELDGRCLILTGIEAWNAVTSLSDPHILIADFDLEGEKSDGTLMLEKARRGRHSVIYSGRPGGMPHLNRVSLATPDQHHIQSALKKAGYQEGRARALSQKFSGNLDGLLRHIQGLATCPEWSQEADASDLVVALLLGEWSEDNQADQTVAESLSKKPYGEWIGAIREIALRPNAPLTHRNGVWKFVTRYEGWYSLGARVFDEHLDCLREVSILVLQERHPRYELTPEDRLFADARGMKTQYSSNLRRGLAETLALLGSHSAALTSCSRYRAETVSSKCITAVLESADWVCWASVEEYLPLLAEAAPRQFLDAVENALGANPCPFEDLFAQERPVFIGKTYLCGLLWALETLAWDGELLSRVVAILGELAEKDPGGNWSNRPLNSLTTILLPWMPQTLAPIEKMEAAAANLLKETPGIGWKVLIALLPNSFQISVGSHKPKWREIRDGGWARGVSYGEFSRLAVAYARLLIQAAAYDTSRLSELVEHLSDFPPPTQDELLDQLASEELLSLPESDQMHVWRELADLSAKHHKYRNAEWSLPERVLTRIDTIAGRLSPKRPSLLYQRLFSERESDLYEEIGDYNEQSRKLQERRGSALAEMLETEGLDSVLDFSKVVESPWRVGFTLGTSGPDEADTKILPSMLTDEEGTDTQVAGGFVSGRLRAKGWDWVDAINIGNWPVAQRARYLAYLPFDNETWRRVTLYLGNDESAYWAKASVNPYLVKGELNTAIERLIQYGRPVQAIDCIHKLVDSREAFDVEQSLRALRALHSSENDIRGLDAYATREVIRALQNEPSIDSKVLCEIEWQFLPLLDPLHGASPKTLERSMAENPEFFCHVICTIFKSSKEKDEDVELSDEQRLIAQHAYKLLMNWRIPPGSGESGEFDADKFTEWLKNVVQMCEESGHLEIALVHVGNVLTYVPPDPKGLWIYESVAQVLNEKHAKDMRDGFFSQTIMSRGAHWVDPEGKPERELAEKYRQRAENLDVRGLYRFAETLRNLERFYLGEANRIAQDLQSEDS